MTEMQAERGALGIIEGRPLPVEARDRVLNRMVELFIREALAGFAQKKPRKKKQSDMTDEEWIATVEQDEAFRGLNIRHEIARCGAWYKQNIAKTGAPSRRRIINWLLKQEKIVDLKLMGAQHATGLKLPAPKGPEGWMEWLRTELATISEEHPAHGQLTAALNCRQFTMMPQSFQQRCRTAHPQSA
jgi:hypothetical protein